MRPRLPIALLLLAGLVPGCGQRGEAGGAPRTPDAVLVAVAPALTRPVTRWIDVVGTLDADEDVTVSAKVGGRVAEVSADLGDTVLPGAPLARLDPSDYELALRQAEAALREALAQVGLEEFPGPDFDVSGVALVLAREIEAEAARAKRDRARATLEQGSPAVSPQEYADLETVAALAEANVAVAREEVRALLAAAGTRQAEVAQARQALDDALIVAPDRGSAAYAVAERLVSPGTLVAPGAGVFRLVDSDPVRFRVRLPERYVPGVAVGQAVEVHTESSTEALSGRVARISPAIDPQSRTCTVEIDIANPDGRLRPGGFARGRIAVRTDDAATFVPAASVVSFAGVERIFSVRDGKAVEHRVQTGVRDGNLVEVVAGLSPPADVVVQGQERLAPGTPVRLGAP